jgi:hypothetical protein
VLRARTGLAEGHKSGLVEGKRDALLRLLARRRLALSDEHRATIQACGEVATLDGWFDRALEASSVADVLTV